jgi:hypothetical protein
MFNRLKEHAESVNAAENLSLKDFHCRFLVVEDIWIPLGETLLIAKFPPIWNKLIDGFGNHDPDKGRYRQVRSKWDTLYPGRDWVQKCSPRLDSGDIIKIRETMAEFIPSSHIGRALHHGRGKSRLQGVIVPR